MTVVLNIYLFHIHVLASLHITTQYDMCINPLFHILTRSDSRKQWAQAGEIGGSMH